MVHRLNILLDDLIQFDENKSKTAKNIAKTAAYTGALGGLGYGGYKAAKEYQRIRDTHLIPAIDQLRTATAPAVTEIKKSAIEAIDAARKTAEHFQGTSEATRVATSHLYSLGKLWRNIGFTHDPANPGGAEYMLKPGVLRAHVRKGYKEGLAGVKTPRTPTSQIGYGLMRNLLKSGTPWRQKTGKLIASGLSKLNSKLDDLIEFARGDQIEKLLKQIGEANPKNPLAAVLSKVKVNIPRKIKGVKSIGASPLGLAVRKQQNKRLLSSLLDDLINFQSGDPRDRNQWGQFTQEEGGPDPNAMAKTYRQPGLGTVAVGAGVAGAAGTAAGLGVKYTADQIKRLRKIKV